MHNRRTTELVNHFQLLQTPHPRPISEANHFKGGLSGAETESSLWFCLSFLFLLRLLSFRKLYYVVVDFCIAASLSVICRSFTHVASPHRITSDITPHSTRTSLRPPSLMFTSFGLVSPLWSR